MVSRPGTWHMLKLAGTQSPVEKEIFCDLEEATVLGAKVTNCSSTGAGVRHAVGHGEEPARGIQ